MNDNGLFVPGEFEDRAYMNIRDRNHPVEAHARERIERYWMLARDYLDGNLRSRAQRDLFAAYWELYLAASLIELGFALARSDQFRRKGGGPDILIPDHNVWIEATAPGPGGGDDAIPPVTQGEFAPVPENEIVLRLTGALSEKKRKFDLARHKGIVSPEDRCIIAISGGRLEHRYGDRADAVHWIVRAVFPLGSLSIRVHPDNGQITSTHLQHRPQIWKKSGSPVKTTFFFKPENADISAVLYSCADPWNQCWEDGEDFLAVHNPLARRPLERGFFRAGRESWLENGRLCCEPVSRS